VDRVEIAEVIEIGGSWYLGFGASSRCARRRIARDREGKGERMSGTLSSDLGLLPDVQELEQVVDLDAFQRHVEELSEGTEFSFAKEYSMIKRTEANDEYRDKLTPNTDETVERNRYMNIRCIEEYRAKLTTGTQDYINASLVDVSEEEQAPRYIAAQAPLENTFEDFWRLVWEYDVPMILMLTPWSETTGDWTRVKADPYLPLEEGNVETYGEFTVKCKAILKADESLGITVREYRLFPVGEEGVRRKLYHVHFVKWPDFGGVSDFSMYLEVHAEVQRCLAMARRANPSKRLGPLLTHCSAGVGRTGTFIAIDVILAELRRRAMAGRVKSSKRYHIDVASVVATLRTQRPGMVIAINQYLMVYHVIYFAVFGVSLKPAVGNPRESSALSDNERYKKNLA